MNPAKYLYNIYIFIQLKHNTRQLHSSGQQIRALPNHSFHIIVFV